MREPSRKRIKRAVGYGGFRMIHRSHINGSSAKGMLQRGEEWKQESVKKLSKDLKKAQEKEWFYLSGGKDDDAK